MHEVKRREGVEKRGREGGITSLINCSIILWATVPMIMSVLHTRVH